MPLVTALYLFIYLFFFLIFFSTFFIYFWDRERQSMNGGGAERERETQNRKQAPGSEPSAQRLTRGSEPDAGLELTDREIVTWLKSDA